MNHERNVGGLKENAQKKRQAAFEKTDQAIRQIIKDGKPISFQGVAKVADVSVAWLYKEQTIKERAVFWPSLRSSQLLKKKNQKRCEY